jgi:CRISPR system Cascade subunit CasD
MHWLLFTLAGPRASFGTEAAVGGERDGQSMPSRSALLGLFAAASGIKREDESVLNTLSADLVFASRLIRRGSQETDYQTAQVAKRKDLKKRVVRTRSDELDAPRSDLTTILSSRVYRCDFHATVAAVYERSSSKGLNDLQSLQLALKFPKWMLYLGRKSSPLAWPLNPKIVEADSFEAALNTYDELGNLQQRDWPASTAGPAWQHSPISRDLNEVQSSNSQYQFAADESLQSVLGSWPTQFRVVTRRDEPRNRMRWQFASRQELRWQGAKHE